MKNSWKVSGILIGLASIGLSALGENYTPAVSRFAPTAEVQLQSPKGPPLEGDRQPHYNLQTADEIVVTASRREAKVFDAPYDISIIGSDDIQSRQLARTVPDILAEEPGVMVQKTSYGQGSPYLRGFTGFRNVFLIDGIRLNNSVFRDGPNQYWNTVDPFTIERLEMVKGPASVMYGSDAIGGAVNAISRDGKTAVSPALMRGKAEDASAFHPRFYYRYASANKSSVSRVETKINPTEQLNMLLGGSLKDFDDLKGGKSIGLQHKTGYNDNSGDFMARYALSDKSTLTLAHQDVAQNDIWRTHRTIYGSSWHGTTVGTDKKHLFDQGRQLTYLQYEAQKPLSFSERIKASLSYQVQTENQLTVKKDSKMEKAGFDVRTTGFWAQSETPALGFGRITAGIEYYSDSVASYRRTFKADGTLNTIEIQGPVADDASYNMTGLFIQDEINLSPKIELTAGLRYTNIKTKADKVKDPLTSAQVGLSDNWSNTVGNLRMLYRLNDNMNCYGGISQGFRAPNLSDLTRYDIAQSGQQEIPNLSLRPERFINYEVGLKKKQANWQMNISAFHTAVTDMIMRYPTGNMIGSNYEVQKANIGDGFVKGFEVKGDYRINPAWSLFGGLAYVRGEVDTYPSSDQVKDREPMSKVQPMQGVIGGRWNEATQRYSRLLEGSELQPTIPGSKFANAQTARYWAEAFIKGAGQQDRLSPEDKLDTQRIPPDGTPGYATVNIRGGWRISRNVSLSAGIENIGNIDYRIHGSGTNEPGRNYTIALDAGF
ncbi:MAG: TonB-dependent receptor [Planctomycetota bacterium]